MISKPLGRIGAVSALIVMTSMPALAASSQPYDVVEQFAEVLSVVEDEYVEPPQRETLAQGAIAGMVGSLDPHSAYMTPEQYREFKQETSGKFAGIGVEVDLRDGQVIIIAPIANSPAEKAGLKSGDRIVALDGVSLESLPVAEIVHRMRGVKGTAVHLVIRRSGVQGPVRIDVTRDDVWLPSIYTRAFDGQIAYVRIAAFQEGTHVELLSRVGELFSQLGKCRGMVLDLRQNPGGLVSESIAVADEFLGSGALFSTRHRGKIVEWVDTTNYGNFERIPLITLVDSGSASAAEIVAGALKDRKRSAIIGERTFGKGTVQSIIDLPGGAGLRLTSLRYYTPSGIGIQTSGVLPDTVLASDETEDNPVRESDLPGRLPNDSPKASATLAKPERTAANETEYRYAAPKPLKTIAQRIAELPARPTSANDRQLAFAYQALLEQLNR